MLDHQSLIPVDVVVLTNTNATTACRLLGLKSPNSGLSPRMIKILFDQEE